MTLKDVRDKLSRMFAQDRSLEETEVNHVLLEDTNGIIHLDYMFSDDDMSDLEDDDDDDEAESWESDSELEDDEY